MQPWAAPRHMQASGTTCLGNGDCPGLAADQSRAAPLPIELTIWCEVPGFAPITCVHVGADGSVVLAAGFNQDCGPRSLLPVTAALARRSYAFSCRMLAPVAGEVLTEDLNPFALQ